MICSVLRSFDLVIIGNCVFQFFNVYVLLVSGNGLTRRDLSFHPQM